MIIPQEFISNINWTQFLIVLVCSIIGSITAVQVAYVYFARYCRKIGLTGADKHKADQRQIPASGGLVVLCGIFTGLFMLIIFYNSLQVYFSVMLVMLIITIVGQMDDYAKKYGGLRQYTKPIMTLSAAIPLMVIHAGSVTMTLPLVGVVNWGWFYTLVIIPIGVMGASNMVNLLAGYNGLETGLGIVYIGALTLYAIATGHYDMALLGIIVVAALISFFFLNKYPAKIFPGDSLTYLIGAVAACMAILGDLEKIAIICAIPYLIEGVLKAKSNFKAQSFGVLSSNGKIIYTGKIYSIPHILGRTGRFTESQIVWIIMAFHAVCCAIPFLVGM
jgi:UDP-N-acetylglucosamine--dolichyl-phosphate N-acetylglucosaminephosphotransferase